MKKNRFAEGFCFDKIFSVFVIGAYLGNAIETLFCRVKFGRWMNRSSFLYGHFSAVWGLGFAIATVLFYNYSDSPVGALFLAGMLFGGIYEYVCSAFTEKFMGARFWDYRSMRFNLKGRINLVYCAFWGVAAVIWVKDIFPVLESIIERIPKETGERLSAVLFGFFVINGIISLAAIRRYVERRNGSEERNRFSDWLDNKYSDARIEKVYPLMKLS